MRRKRRKNTNQQDSPRNHQSKSSPPKEPMIETPNPFRAPIEQNPKGDERYREEQDSRSEQLRTARRLNWITVVGVAGAIVYAIITYYQWQDQRIDFKRSQRPWVGPVMPVDASTETMFDRIEVNVPIRWHYKIRNYGNSPALNSTLHSRVFFIDPVNVNWNEVQADIDNLEIFKDLPITLFNGQESVNYGISEHPITDSVLTRIKSQQIMVILGGKIQYFDEFREKHTTTFCVIYRHSDPGKFPGSISCPVIPIAD
jgi:hypothetical protein